MQVNGTITNVRSVTKQSRAGKPFTIKYLTVDTFDQEINIGWEKGYETGDPFYKEIEQNQYGEWVPSKGGAAGASQTTNKSNVSPVHGQKSYGKTYPVAPDHPDMAIINQNSMLHATALVNGMLECLDMNQFSTTSDIEAALAYRVKLATEAAAEIARFSSGRATAEKVSKMLEEQEVA